MTPLEILEDAALDADAAFEVIKAAWVEEDAATKRRRDAVVASWEQGLRDRDAVRMSLGGASRMSSLPVTPLAALDQPTEPEAV